jgi:tetraprenyl-beta-curcumene synthase
MPRPAARTDGAELACPETHALDRRLAARAGVALVLVIARYWTSVAPLVRGQMHRWREHAQAINDPVLRALALTKLEEEGFNAEAAAMLATIAPRRHRRGVVEAMVALEVMYDYLDGLTESPCQHTPADGGRLFTAFTDAVAPSVKCSGDYYRRHPRAEDCYLEALVATVRSSLSELPATDRLTDILRASAARGAAAQLQIHGASSAGVEMLEQWAKLQAAGTALQWQEFLAGAACSVLSVHALIAAASDSRVTYQQALELDDIYLSISVLPTILDSLIDHEADAASGRASYLQHYDTRDVLAQRLASVISGAVSRSRSAPRGAHHVMTLVGVFAYYASLPAANSEFARPVTAPISKQLRPLLTPALTMMRGWRAAKSLRGRWRRVCATRTGRAT